MRKDKLNSWNIRYFLVPFIILIILFSIVTYVIAENRIDERYKSFEEQSISMADSYSQALIYAHDAQSIITDMLNEKLIIVSKAISMIDNHDDIAVLVELAKELNLDEISLYNSDGEIIFSNYEDFIGWKVYEGHPIYDFMMSDDNTMVEDIRQDVISGVYKKYGYVKNEDGSFIQIGELAETVHNLIGQFEFQQLVNIIAGKDDIVYVTFLDNDFSVLGSSVDQTPETNLIDESFKERIENEDYSPERIEYEGQDLLQTSVPIYHDGEKNGTLNILWSTESVDKEIYRLILDGFIQISIVFVFMTGVLFYAYRKNKSNIEIAFYDKLTGLPNDEYLMEYLEELIADFDDKKAIMLINTKNFKTLNMTYGFSYGDFVITQIAKKIKGVLESDDRLFRFNADRFILVVNSYGSREELIQMSWRILEVFRNESMVTSEYQYVNVELGIVEIRDSDTTVDRLLQDATLALSYIDNNTNSPVRFYEEAMEDVVRREDRIEKSLRAIINETSEDSLYLCYQPKMDIKGKQIMGYEALARLHLQDIGNISPLEFIDIAERRQLIYDLGKIILKKSCEFLSRVNRSGFAEINVSVNISGMQILRKEFVDDVFEIANSYKVDPGYLEFEITESVLLENYEIINQKLKQIKEMGISISIDDFGTGFSSLARLKELNIDIVKIDKYFIDGIIEKDETKIITADIISMAHKMGLKVVAEGVEYQKQMDYLEKNHCDMIQGYFLSKPIEEQEAIENLGKFIL
ncbi:putative bifunctional diguanylate cyclase/phosphodiesterase [Gudongella sp. DL1XJH-153]|uniref:putative bifunctional diguanylate cyclase/phosphodiesterase n=1 Tax=Gudongella sp. DL1XJH-153 TaxID=3409804 RepID=UPI003BB5B0A7